VLQPLDALGCFGRRNCNVNLDDLDWDRPDLGCEPQRARGIPAIFNWTRQDAFVVCRQARSARRPVQRDLISAQPCAQAQLLINAVLYFNCIESLAHTWATACPKSVPPPPSGSPHSRRCDRGGVDELTSPPAVLAAYKAIPRWGPIGCGSQTRCATRW
jgi:hypothetical protein